MINLKEKIDLTKFEVKHEHIGEFLNIKFVEVTETSLIAKMPITSRTHQPWGILHGGVSVVLAESIGSFGSSLLVDQENYMAVGLEVNANHIRPVKSGMVKGVGTPVHLGRKTHVWDIKIYNEQEKVVCVSRLTVAIVRK